MAGSTNLAGSHVRAVAYDAHAIKHNSWIIFMFFTNEEGFHYYKNHPTPLFVVLIAVATLSNYPSHSLRKSGESQK